MGWPYHLLDLTKEEKHERRLLLDRYGVYAQLSALIPVLAYQLYRLGFWVYSERQRSKVRYSAVPSSPTLKRTRKSTSGVLVRKWRTTIWWLESEVAVGWGLRGQWVAAGCWVSWLLFLCAHKTGEGTSCRIASPVLSTIFGKAKIVSFLEVSSSRYSGLHLRRSCPLQSFDQRGFPIVVIIGISDMHRDAHWILSPFCPLVL